MKKLTKVETYKVINELIQFLDIPAEEREFDESQKQYLIDNQEEECWRKNLDLNIPLEIFSWGRVYHPAFIDLKNCIREGKLLNLSSNHNGNIGMNFMRDGRRKRLSVGKLMKETF